MTIAYPYGTSLYVNITNRCSNRCSFCIRTQADGFYADSLWLEREPTAEEILADLLAKDPTKFDGVVFCGYGEPTERLDDMLFVCRALKERFPTLPIRLNTNGQADLIAGRNTAPDFAGALDVISISLNAATAAGYQAICRSRYGEEAFSALLTFARNVKAFVPSVILSVVRSTIPDAELADCQTIADACGVPLRIREYIQTKD